MTALPGGFRHKALETSTSTNTECLEAARKGETGNLWITAQRQTAGRGSRGRQWVSETGNLFASLLLVDPCEPKHLGGLTFVAALALREALLQVIDGQEIRLKWPNDVLVDQLKCSGILLETSVSAKRTAVVIGIGVNCAHHPADTRFAATSLAELGVKIEPQDMFLRLADAMASELANWDRGRNFAGVLETWLDHAWGIGEPVEVGLYDGSRITGVFDRLTEFGQMVLSQKDGRKTILSVGDIFAIGT